MKMFITTVVVGVVAFLSLTALEVDDFWNGFLTAMFAIIAGLLSESVVIRKTKL